MTGQIKVIVGLLLFCGVAAAGALFGEKAITEREQEDAILAELQKKDSAAPGSASASAVGTAAAHGATAAQGQQVYNSFGCVGCHSFDGSMRVGPSFLNMYGRQEKLADGSTITVDDEYIRESLSSPNAKIVSGFVPTMPSFSGKLENDDVAALIAWFKTLH